LGSTHARNEATSADWQFAGTIGRQVLAVAYHWNCLTFAHVAHSLAMTVLNF
jgi:hypothetical protein